MTLRAMLLQIQSVDGQLLTVPKGHHAHAFFLRLIEEVDPELSRHLHDEQARKPYTIARADSSSIGSHEAQIPQRRADAWLRLTMLDDTLFDCFVARVTALARAEDDRGRLRLGQSRVTVSGLIDGHGRGSVVGQTSFEELLAEASLNSDVSLRYATPTAFSLGTVPGGHRRVGLLPDASLVFHSLLRKWNAFAPAALSLDPAWREVIDEECAVAAYDARTDSFAFPRHTQLGFTGWCRYRVLSDDPQLRRLVNALADFASFAGVGSKTTMGMGQTWRAVPPTAPGQGRRSIPRVAESAPAPIDTR